MTGSPCPSCGSTSEKYGNGPVLGQQTVLCDGCGDYKRVYVRQVREGEHAMPFIDPAPLQRATGKRYGI